MNNLTLDDIGFIKPGEKLDDWIVVQEGSVAYDRETAMLSAFKRDFPGLSLLGRNEKEQFDYLNKVVSRSSFLREWSNNFGVSYVAAVTLPLYLKEIVTPAEFESSRIILNRCNDIISANNITRDRMADDYKAKLKLLNESETKSIQQIRASSKIVAVLTIKQEDLPLSIQMAIEGYTPKDPSLDVASSRKKYSRECLIRFKRALLIQVNKDPNFDVDSAVNNFRSK